MYKHSVFFSLDAKNKRQSTKKNEKRWIFISFAKKRRRYNNHSMYDDDDDDFE